MDTGVNSKITSSPKATALRSGLLSIRRPATWVTVPNGTPLHGARYTPTTAANSDPTIRKTKSITLNETIFLSYDKKFIKSFSLWMDKSNHPIGSILYRVYIYLPFLIPQSFHYAYCFILDLSSIFTQMMAFLSKSVFAWPLYREK